MNDDAASTIAAAAEGADSLANAAGVQWGSDPVPARMVELQRRHDAIVALSIGKRLSFHDIKDHNEFLAALTNQIFEEGEAMKRKFRLATAQAVRSVSFSVTAHPQKST